MAEFSEAAHEGILKTAEVGQVFHLICEDVTGIALSGDMEDIDAVIMNPFTGTVFPKFHMVHIFHGYRVGPVHNGFLVIVN